MVRIAVILALALLQALQGAPEWLHPGGAPYLVRALSYSFFHGNWWHLAVNAIAIWTIFDPRRKTCKPCTDLLLSFLIAVAVYPLSLRPVIGCSNILYATLGMRTPPLSSPWWKQGSVITFLVVTVAMVFIPRFSATTHVAAFLLGMGVASFRRFKSNLLRDAGRYL